MWRHSNESEPVVQAGVLLKVRREARAMTPNPSIEGTRSGIQRVALLSFWAMRVLPLRAPPVRRHDYLELSESQQSI